MAEEKVKVRMVVSRPGYPKSGSVVQVSRIRADRWCQEGLATAVGKAKAAAKEEAKAKEEAVST